MKSHINQDVLSIKRIWGSKLQEFGTLQNKPAREEKPFCLPALKWRSIIIIMTIVVMMIWLILSLGNCVNDSGIIPLMMVI
jgi:hypothetical protein